MVRRRLPAEARAERGVGDAMKELVRSNDPVKLSWLQALLSDAGIESYLLDNHMSVLEGSLPLLQRRLAVLNEDYDDARRVLQEAGEELPGVS
jgi:hypothetical protein